MRRATSRGILTGVNQWGNCNVDTRTRMPSTASNSSMAHSVSSN